MVGCNAVASSSATAYACSSRVHSSKYRKTSPTCSRVLARSVVRAGLAEIPLGLPRGPLESCGRLAARGRLRAAWGRVLASGDIELPATVEGLDSEIEEVTMACTGPWPPYSFAASEEDA